MIIWLKNHRYMWYGMTDWSKNTFLVKCHRMCIVYEKLRERLLWKQERIDVNNKLETTSSSGCFVSAMASIAFWRKESGERDKTKSFACSRQSSGKAKADASNSFSSSDSVGEIVRIDLCVKLLTRNTTIHRSAKKIFFW